MAKKSDTQAPASSMRRGKTGRVFVWIILVLLIAGLAGFGAGGLGGSIASIGKVGETEISVQDFQRALQQELSFETRRRGAPVSIQQARAEGLDQRVLERLAGVAALSEETKMAKLSVGDAEVANQLRAVPAFQGPDGQFNRDSYEFALRQNGTRPGEFEDELRLTAARNILQQSVTGGLTVDETYASTIYGFLGERRSFRWAIVDAAMLDGETPAPTDAQLQSFYETNGSQFETPEVRKVTYAWITPEMIIDKIEVDEAQLRELYDARAEQYIQPERRLVERLGFADADAAAAAKAQIDAGEITFDQLVTDRGLTLQDVDQGEVSRDDLTAEVADAVFALTEPGVTDPVNTSLGPVLYRVNALLEATTVTFEDARSELTGEFTADRARRDIGDQITEFDDLLVGGASIEELGTETDMQSGTLDFTADVSDGIAGYDEFRNEVAQLTTSDFPEIRELSDGGAFAVRLDEIVAPALPPLADIRADVVAAWTADQTAQRLAALGTELQEKVAAGTRMASLDLAAKAETDLGRTDFIEEAPIGMLATVFDLEENGVAFVQGPQGRAALVELTNISAPDTTTERAQALLAQLNSAASEGLAADVFELFGQAVQSQHGLTLDQTAVNAVLTQFGGGHGGI
ncbi:peptidylprolyl isomerase [uncultured Litoreibacter sp.]|uniref:peptidylprolyl isomerase n=1 Tax=uncultured Litoreibacter sp. TaxID=1392394 RepID=UPI00261CF960|nr:peptidylprolyl isomerase [uncultured Litoreibacter sp.]